MLYLDFIDIAYYNVYFIYIYSNFKGNMSVKIIHTEWDQAI